MCVHLLQLSLSVTLISVNNKQMFNLIEVKLHFVKLFLTLEVQTYVALLLRMSPNIFPWFIAYNHSL